MRTRWENLWQPDAAWEYLKTRPHVIAGGLIVLYLLILQPHFLFSGDTWGEAYPEYLNNALSFGWQNFFTAGWAGYFNFIPRILVDTYVWLHLPIGYIDHFYRLAVITFVLLCTAFIAHPYNRAVIKSDLLRIFLALASVLMLYHVSSFSFINVWYVGFVVVALVSLHNERFKTELSATIYATVATAICFSKPSIVLLPLVLYRTIRLKEWLLGFIVSFAILVETLMLATSSYIAQAQPQHLGAKRDVYTMILGSAIMWLKTFHVYPLGLWVVGFAALILTATFLAVLYSKKIWQTVALFIAFAFSIYTYFLSPDASMPSVVHQYRAIYLDQFKLQREFTITFFIAFLSVLALEYIWQRWGRHQNWATPAVLPILLLVVLTIMYRPIDVQGAAVYADMSQFRSDLNHHVSVCLPIAPTPDWVNPQAPDAPVGSWFFQYYGGCTAVNNGNKTLLQSRLNDPIGSGWQLGVDGLQGQALKSILIPIQNPNPAQSKTLILTDLTNHKSYTAAVHAKSNHEQLSFIAFNLSSESAQSSYSFTLTERGNKSSRLLVGSFKEGGDAYYGFFMGYPNLGDYAHWLKAQGK